MSDEQIWEGVRVGDKSAVKVLYDRYFNSLYSYGLKITHDIASTEDAIHDLFLDLWKYRDGLSPTTSIRFYLYRALRRKVYKTQITADKALKIDKNSWSIDESDQSIEENIIDGEEREETIVRFKESMKDLPSRQQESIMLRFYGELSYKEIGEILDVNEQSARNLVNRGLMYLRKTLYLIGFLWYFLLS